MARAIGRPLSNDTEIEQALVAEIATTLDNAGTQSILDVFYYNNQALNVAIFYDIKTGHVFGDGIEVTPLWTGPPINGGGLFAIYGNKRENDFVYLFYTKDGFPVFYSVGHDTGSDWVDIRGGLIFVGSVVLGAIGGGLAAGIGEAAIGTEAATAYPALANAIGQTAINTLMNGGDIEAAAKSAIASYAGAGVGGQVVSATGYDALGSASAAATRAYINGGDVGKAAAQSFFQSGVTNVQSLLLSGMDDSFDPLTYDPNVIDTSYQSFDPNIDPIGVGVPAMSSSYYTDENGITYGVDANGDLAVVDYVDPSGIGYATDAQGDVAVLDAPTSADISQASTGSDANGTVPYGSPQQSSNSLSVLTTLATAALPLLRSYVQAGMPAVRAGTASSTVNSNGTITTRNANGTVTVSRPAAGTPYVTANGSVVTNNGDGTFSTVSPNGALSTTPYATLAASSGSAANMPLYLGLGLVALLALSR